MRLRLVGTVAPNVWKALEAHDLTTITEHVPYVEHKEAIRYMRQAGLLLLVIEEFPQAEGMMTGKIYEYLASGRPVLGIGPSEGDASVLLRKTEGGQLFGWDEEASIRRFLREHYEAWSEGLPFAGAPPERLAPYRRREQTQRLAEVLTDVSS